MYFNLTLDRSPIARLEPLLGRGTDPPIAKISKILLTFDKFFSIAEFAPSLVTKASSRKLLGEDLIKIR
jgi:hypothetical protein